MYNELSSHTIVCVLIMSSKQIGGRLGFKQCVPGLPLVTNCITKIVVHLATTISV